MKNIFKHGLLSIFISIGIISIAAYSAYNIIGSAKGIRIEYMYFGNSPSGGLPTLVCGSGTCGMPQNSGPFSAPVFASTGQYTSSFTAGTWSTPPLCFATSGLSGVAAGGWAVASATSTTALAIDCYNAAGSLANCLGRVVCIGAR
jgi:hypothetical protein